MSNKYSDQLMQALEVVVDEKISTLQFDKTIQATITEIENADTGEYKVNYKEGIISAFAQDPKELFKVGDRVYVTVPEGDFSNKKFISHKITNNSLSTGQYTDLAETIVEVSPDFQNLDINYSKDEIGLIAGSQPPDTIYLVGTFPVSWEKVIRSDKEYQYYMDFSVQQKGNNYQWQYKTPNGSWTDSPAEGNKTATLQIPASTSRNKYQYKCIVDGVASSIVQLFSSGGVNYSAELVNDLSIGLSNNFKLYNEKYEYIQISAEFMTTLEEQDNKIINKGDYGVILNFSDSNNQIVSCILNLSNFVGDPYHLWTWLPQSAVVKLPKGVTKLQNIKFYEQSFDDSQIISSTEPNIFMRNLSLSFVEIVDLTNTPYYLTIVPQEGIIFGNNNSLHLTGRIIHYGTEINPSTCIYKWFERDLSVVAGSEEYDKRVGWGWKAVDNGESKTLEVLNSEVTSQQTFKLLVVYDSSIIMTREITLIADELKATIEQVISGNEIRLKLTSTDNKSYVGEWYYLNNSGEQVLITEGRVNETGNIVPYLFYPPTTFYCAVYNGNKYLGELSYVMRNMESSEDVSVVFIGESMFAYDANGDIRISDAEFERSLVPEVVFNDDSVINSITIDWLDFNGNVISESGDEFDSTDSMIKSVRVDKTTNTLYYKIKHKFQDNPSKKKNTFKIKITTLNGQVYTFDKEIVFIKTGDPGTNGTRYQALLQVTSDCKYVFSNGLLLEVSKNSIKLKWDKTEGATKYQIDKQIGSASWQTIENNCITTNYTDNSIQPNTKYTYIVYPYINEKKGTGNRSLTVTTPEDSTVSKRPNYSNQLNGKVKVTCVVYKDSNILSPNQYTIKWTFINLIQGENETSDASSRSITVKAAGNSNRRRYVKAEITIDDDENNEKTILYNFFGVDSSTDVTITEIDLSELPKFIQYNASGLEPQCRKQVPEIDGIKSLSSGDLSLLTIVEKKFIPVKIFNPKNNIALLSLTTTVGSNTIFHPIPMYINTFGNEAINGWDGVEVFLGDDQDHAIFAPQVGAGEKDADNKFTGVIMGKDSAQKEGTKQLIGLYGYQQGETVFGLMENGKAFFGKAGQGRIEINGNDATIKGGGGGGSESGMTITLANQDIGKDSKAIRVGKDNFIVTYGGKVTANGAVIRGVLSAGSGSRIGCTFDNNGTPKDDGWSVTENQISSGNVYLYSGQDKFTRGYTWRLNKNSVYYKINSEHTAIVGSAQTITANTPVTLTVFEAVKLNVGGSEGDYDVFKFTNDNNEYCSLTTNVYAASYYRIWSGSDKPSSANFVVTSAGYLVAKNAEVIGSIKATRGYIGGTSSGWSIENNAIFSGKTSFVIKAKSKYYTDEQFTTGEQTVSEDTEVDSYAVIKNTDKANFTFKNSSTIYYTLKSSFNSNYIRLQTNGTYAIFAGHIDGSSAPFSVTHGGTLKATNADIQGKITAESGKIGGWTISSNLIYQSGVAYLYAGTDYIVDEDEKPPRRYRLWIGNKTPANAPFSVIGDGTFKATNATIEGDITAKTGYIGGKSGWIIDSNKIYGSKTSSNSTKYVALSTQGNYAIYAGSSGEDTDGEKGKPANAPFWVKFDGSFKATSATIEGNITANSGRIAGWVINGNKLQVRTSATNTSTNLYLNGGPWDDNTDDSKKYVIYMSVSNPNNDDTSNTNGRFYVTSSGHMFAQSAEIRGTIKSKAGSIGAWTITNNAISTLTSETTTVNNNTTGMAKNGFTGYIGSLNGEEITSIAFWAGMSYKKSGNDYYLLGSSTGSFFAVTHSGKLYCRSADISGKITADRGSIGGWTIANDKLYSGDVDDPDVYIGPSGFKFNGSGNNSGTFSVINGRLNATSASFSGTITGSAISGGTITGGAISGGTITGTSISGGTICGAIYYDEDETSSLNLAKNISNDPQGINNGYYYGLEYKYGNINIFKVYRDAGGSFYFNLGNKDFISYNGYDFIITQDVSFKNYVDFTYATITGLDTTATFG